MQVPCLQHHASLQMLYKLLLPLEVISSCAAIYLVCSMLVGNDLGKYQEAGVKAQQQPRHVRSN